MKHYTSGFIFTPDLKRVLLIHKNRPDFQVGKVNGVGGKVEPGEEIEECIVREVREETGVETKKTDWQKVTELQGDDWLIHVFTTIQPQAEKTAKTLTDEEVEWFNVSELPENIMSNLSWQIPMALEKLANAYKTSVVMY